MRVVYAGQAVIGTDKACHAYNVQFASWCPVKTLRTKVFILEKPRFRHFNSALPGKKRIIVFVYADTLDEARMLVAGNRGFLPLMMRTDEGATGTVIRRIPLIDAAGAHRRQEFFAFWPKVATTPLTEEFAEILAELFS